MVNVGLDAIGMTVPMVGAARAGAGLVGKMVKGASGYARGVGAGLAQTAVSQGLGIASGRQEKVDPIAAAIDIGSMSLAAGLANIAGKAVGEVRAADTLRRFGDRAAIAQDLIDSGAAKVLGRVPAELQPAVKALIAGKDAAEFTANVTTEFGSDVIELIADQAVARAQGQDPGPVAHAIYSAVIQSLFGSAMGGGAAGHPNRVGIDQQTVTGVLDEATRPDPNKPWPTWDRPDPARDAELQQIHRATGQVLERQQGQESAAARKEELIGTLARRAAADRAQQLYEANESDAALARRALGDRAEMETVAAQAVAAQGRSADRAKAITLADEARTRRAVTQAGQRITPSTVDNNPALQQRLAEIERVQGSPVTAGQREMAIRAVVGGQRDVLPRAPEMTKEAIAGRVGEMYRARQPAQRQRTGFTGMEKLRFAQEAVVRQAQQIRDEAAQAKTTIGKTRARMKAEKLARDTVESGTAKARAYKSKTVYAQAMLAGRDWVAIDRAGNARRLTAQEALGLASDIDRGKTKVEEGGLVPGRRGRPEGLSLRLSDGTTIRIYRTDTADAWVAVREAFRRGDAKKAEDAARAALGMQPSTGSNVQQAGESTQVEEMYSGLHALFARDPDAATAALRSATATETATAFWEKTIRKPLRDILAKVVSLIAGRPIADRFADAVDHTIFTVGEQIPLDVRADFKNIQAKVRRESFEIYKAREALNAAIKRASGGDSEVARDITAAVFLAAEAEGEGSGIPSAFKVTVDVQRAKLGGEFDNLQKLMRDYGKAALRMGNLMVDAGMLHYAVYKNTKGTLIPQTRAQYEGTSHEGLTLVGGFKRFEDIGGYMAHVYHLAAEADGYKGQGNVGKYRLSNLVGWRVPEVRDRLSARTRNLEEATAAGLYLSHEPTSIAIAAEAEAVARKKTADMFRKMKLIRSDDEMDDISTAKETVGAVTRTRKEIDDAKAMLADLSREMKKTEPGQKRNELLSEQTWLRSELRNLEANLRSLERALTTDGWTVLRGPQYGEYDSNLRLKDKDGNSLPQKTWYIRSDLLQTVKPSGQQHYAMRMYRVLHGQIKSNLAGGGNPLRYFIDKLTNTRVNYYLGYNQLSKEGREMSNLATKHILAAMRGDPVTDEAWQQFDFDSQQMSFGGPGDQLEADTELASKAKSSLIKAMQEGNTGDAVASGGELLFDKWNKLLDKVPVFGRARRFYRMLTDRRDAYFVYLMARKYGPNGDGPMSHEDAMQEAARAYDLNGISRLMRVLAAPLSFLRYRVKLGQQLATMWTREPRLYGRRLGIAEPLTKIITEKPGSWQAQTALGVRGAMGLAAKYAEWKIPLSILTYTLLATNDISDDEWEKALNEEYKNWPAPVAWMLKQVTIPIGRGEDGLPRVLLLDPLMPALALWQYIVPKYEPGFLWQQLQKNVLIWPLAQMASNRDYMNRPMPGGVGPGSASWPVLSAILPLAIKSPIEQVAKAIEHESSFWEIAEEAAQYLTGFKIKSVPDFLRREVGKFQDEGLVVRVELPEEGRGWLQPAIDSNHPMYQHVQMILGLLRATNASQRFERQLQRSFESYEKGMVR